MSDLAFADFTEQVLSLSYDQTLILMSKMLESLKAKRSEENYAEMEKDIWKLFTSALTRTMHRILGRTKI